VPVGDVVVIAALDDTTEDGARIAIERIQTGLRLATGDVGLTVSAGIACYPTHALEAPIWWPAPVRPCSTPAPPASAGWPSPSPRATPTSPDRPPRAGVVHRDLWTWCGHACGDLWIEWKTFAG